ncbi:MAG: hypothetical protein KAS82_02265 [Bacteroidales bacterium]|nr:hypothetical protein [Bacteroidales bacterium]
MKRLIPALLYLITVWPLQAQNNSFVMEPESPSVIGRISLISPKLIAEIALSDYFTLSVGFWLKTNFWDYDEWGPGSPPYVSPSFKFEPRYYFNLEDRHDKGKSTRYYSGWYISLPFNIEFPDFRYSVGGTIGFQCIMGRRWYWNISIGPGFTYSDSRFYWSGAGDFGLGIILNKM